MRRIKVKIIWVESKQYSAEDELQINLINIVAGLNVNSSNSCTVIWKYIWQELDFAAMTCYVTRICCSDPDPALREHVTKSTTEIAVLYNYNSIYIPNLS